jgi:centromeric protein E
VPPEVSEKLAGLESELRKSKRAEQKLQAMLYRLRKDLQDAGGDLATFDRLQEVRTLEYEVDFLTNKVKVREGLPCDRRASGMCVACGS